jgi:hypothetical protein
MKLSVGVGIGLTEISMDSGKRSNDGFHKERFYWKLK